MYILVKAGIVRGLLGAELNFMLCTQSQYSTVYSIQCEYTVKKKLITVGLNLKTSVVYCSN